MRDAGTEGLLGNSKSDGLTGDGGEACFACQISQKYSDYSLNW